MSSQGLAKEHYEMGLKKTPFYSRQKELDIMNEWHRWSGYTVPNVLNDVTFEYFAIRNSASVFDITPMAKYRIKGPDALDFMNRLLTRDMTKLRVGRVGYSVWCDDEGMVIDDGTVFRTSENEYLLCAQERQLETLKRNALGFDISFDDVSDDIAALSFQGPLTCTILKKVGFEGIDQLKMFDLKEFAFAGTTVMISRTGYTGDLGYELWINPENAGDLWDALFEAGKNYNVKAIGGDALEIARIEAGLLMAGKDFSPATSTVRPGHAKSPYELGLDWLVKLDKGVVFNGRRALIQERNKGPRYRFVRLDVEGNKTACSAYIFDRQGGKTIGHVSSAAWAPTAKKNVALGFVDMPYGEVGSTVWVEIYYQKELRWNRRWAKAVVMDGPFYNPERKTLTPPEAV
ncbi:glycine cleavage system protein T [Kordiimonas sediminis]|uniref:Glycine cleavage system protein T n=1 Tax=Kordiimonas sediminis TaxID=1735581 RepID=A0A919AWB1_9PROT|nr:aminomethyltransferase family protein [Kordiimonas sediminis]GHF26523.1 glycine cleavage system protein T [Kordiimonas sediminis]